MKKQHNHNFVENYTGLLAQGLDKETDLATLTVYLQKLADDELSAMLLPRLSETEIDQFFDMIARLLATHLTEEEYHEKFLRDFPEGPRQF